ncbi:hypothetical protein AADEFJLK_00052 [Methylovulum psychrotolerans]|uniref:Uncharacterized protein n=1 Tax=Methylovulum psychrotolerans TaxID=1704499 RepID=A0A2S5CQF9_9GAMM|nr:hypothetical protein AADEFJLK_00052 [Methylovulum psychrotolerans]
MPLSIHSSVFWKGRGTGRVTPAKPACTQVDCFSDRLKVADMTTSVKLALGEKMMVTLMNIILFLLSGAGCSPVAEMISEAASEWST